MDLQDLEWLSFTPSAKYAHNNMTSKYSKLFFGHQELLTCLDGGAIYSCVPAHLQHVAGELLRDEEWLDNVYFPTNLARLKESYEMTVDSLATLGVPVYRAKVLPQTSSLFISTYFP